MLRNFKGISYLTESQIWCLTFWLVEIPQAFFFLGGGGLGTRDRQGGGGGGRSVPYSNCFVHSKTSPCIIMCLNICVTFWLLIISHQNIVSINIFFMLLICLALPWRPIHLLPPPPPPSPNTSGTHLVSRARHSTLGPSRGSLEWWRLRRTQWTHHASVPTPKSPEALPLLLFLFLFYTPPPER